MIAWIFLASVAYVVCALATGYIGAVVVEERDPIVLGAYALFWPGFLGMAVIVAVLAVPVLISYWLGKLLLRWTK